MKRVILLCLSGILTAIPVKAMAAAPSDAVLKITVAGEPSDWILDEKSGRVFVALDGKNCVVEFDPSSGKEVRRFEIGKQTGQMVIKGNRLVVGVARNASLHVVNLDRNQIEGNALLEGMDPPVVFCTSASNRYVYAICDPSRSRVMETVFQVDVLRREIINRAYTTLDNFGMDLPKTVVPSIDGQFLLVDDSTRRQTNLVELDEEAFTFRSIAIHERAYLEKTAGPANRYWMLDQWLVAHDLSAPSGTLTQGRATGLRTFAGSPALIHPKLDLVASVVLPARVPDRRPGARMVDGATLVFQSFSEAADLASVLLTDPVSESARPPSRGSGPAPRLQFDVARNRVFYAFGKEGYVVDMDRLALPRTPQVVVALPSKVSVRVGNELKQPLALSNEGLSSQARFTLADAPKGLRIEDGHIVWRPGVADAGRHEVKVTGQLGEASDTATITVSVEYPSRTIALYPTDLSLSPTGKRVLVLGTEPTAQSQPAWRGAPSRDLRLVDAENLSVIARRTMDADVVDVLVTDSGAYALLANSGVVQKLSLEDLSDQRRSAGTDSAQALAAAYRGHIAVIQDKGRGLKLLDEETLEAVAPPGGSTFERLPRDVELEQIVALDEAFLVGSLVVDADSGTPQLIRYGAQIPRFPSSPRLAVLLARWGRYLERKGNGKSVLTNAGMPLTSLAGPYSGLARDFPAAIEIGRSLVSMNGDIEKTWRLSIDLRDLVEGKSVYQAPLGDVTTQGPQPPTVPFIPRAHSLLDTAGNRVALVVDGTLLIVDLPREVIDGLPEPLRFLPKTSALQLKVGETPVVRLFVRGGQGKRTYAIVNPVKGIRIDEASGDVTFDTPVLWDSYVEHLKRSRSPTAPDPTERVDSAQEAYRRLMGHATDAFPVAVEVAFKVTDEQGGSDVLTPTFLLVGPVDDVVNASAPIPPPGTGPGDPQPREPAANPEPSRPDIARQLGALATSVERARDDLRAVQEQAVPSARVKEAVDRGAKVDAELAGQLDSLAKEYETMTGDLAETKDRGASRNRYLIVGLVLLGAQFVAWLVLFFLMRPR